MLACRVRGSRTLLTLECASFALRAVSERPVLQSDPPTTVLSPQGSQCQEDALDE